MPHQFERERFCLHRLPEKSQRDERFPMDLLSFEDHEHIAGKLLRLRCAICRKKYGREVERGERSVEADIAIYQFLPDSFEQICGTIGVTQAPDYARLYPLEPYSIQVAADLLRQRLDLREEGIGLAIPASLCQSVYKVVPQAEEKPRIADGFDSRRFR